MTRVTGTMGRPIQGISQQPNNTRLDGQCSQSINLRPDVVKGLTTRTGAEWVGLLPFEPSLNDKWLHYKRDEVEEYFINISENKAEGIRIFDKHGNAQLIDTSAVSYNDAMNYLYKGDKISARNLISGLTVGDTTFLSNSSVTVQESVDKTQRPDNVGIVYCQYADYSQELQVYIDGVSVAQVKTPDGSTAAHKEDVATGKIIDGLFAAMNAGGSGLSQFDFILTEYEASSNDWRPAVKISELAKKGITTRSQIKKAVNITKDIDQTGNIYWMASKDLCLFQAKSWPRQAGDTLRITADVPTAPTSSEYNVWRPEGDTNVMFIAKKDGSDFTLSTSDDSNGDNLITVKGSVTDVSKLPSRAPRDFIIMIAPKNGNPSERYYLKAVWRNDDGSDMIWEECAAPDIPLGVDARTMPVTLVRETYGSPASTFSLQLSEWDPREAGDVKTNPHPSFVGSTISDISLFQNRLLIASNESVSLSCSSEFFDFYKTTTQSILDTDPYEVFSDSPDVQHLRNPIAFNGDILFFTDTAQMSLSGQEVVSPNKPTPLRQVSSFETQPNSIPVAAGENIFFAFDYGRFTGIREFFTDSLTDTKRARPVTDHVNQLLSGRTRHMETSTSINMLVVQTEDYLNKLFVYDWMWQGSEKVQAAWGLWEFEEDTEIHNFVMSGSYLYTIYKRGGKFVLVKFDLGAHPDNIGGNANHINFAVDHKKMVTFQEVGQTFEAPLSDLDNLVGYTDASVIIGIQGQGGYDADIGTAIIMEIVGDKVYLDLRASDVPDGTSSLQVLTGLRIESTYTPSNPYPKDADGSARSDFDRLQIGRITVNYDMAGPSNAVLETSSGQSRVLDLSPRTIGNANNTVGFSTPLAGTFRVPIRSRSSQYELSIKSRSHIPLQIRELEFDGLYNRRGRSI